MIDMESNINGIIVNVIWFESDMDLKWIGILEVLVLFCIMLFVIIGNFFVIVVVYC